MTGRVVEALTALLHVLVGVVLPDATPASILAVVAIALLAAGAGVAVAVLVAVLAALPSGTVPADARSGRPTDLAPIWARADAPGAPMPRAPGAVA